MTCYKLTIWKACKYKRELENDTKTDEDTSLVLQTNGGPLHQTPLESDASKLFSLTTERIHFKAPLLSRDARATPTSNILGVVFGTHFLLGP